jgi:peptidoglycan hydrolase-like protein with peptidoglycan-binding domain
MGTGYIRVQATTGSNALPVADAEVTIKQRNGANLIKTKTDLNGRTGDFALPAPPSTNTCSPQCVPVCALCDVDVKAEGYVTKHILAVEIIDTQTTILPVDMEPLVDEPNPTRDSVVEIPPPGLSLTNCEVIIPPPIARAAKEVIIPDYITVHLGRPENTAARRVRVKFPDYVKNVASSEIYATWPEQSLRANIHAIVSFALNRVYTEWYPSRGYNFDITNSTSYDQYYRHDGPVFESISVITDEIFNVYAHRFGYRNPYFTQFCNGTTVTCPGMSQWGTVTLANQGKCALEILRYYYPRDLQLTATDNIAGITASFPGHSLTLGSQGEDVRRIQNDLNRIRINYPLIPLIPNPNGEFTHETQNAVITFQRVFNLPANGVVNRATWNKISSIFTAVSRLAELNGEGIRYTIGENPPNVTLSQGSKGGHVLEMQYILNVVSLFYDSVPPVIIDGSFGSMDRNAVIDFQKTFGLPQTGNVGPLTWNMLYAVYRGIRENVMIPEA